MIKFVSSDGVFSLTVETVERYVINVSLSVVLSTINDIFFLSLSGVLSLEVAT